MPSLLIVENEAIVAEDIKGSLSRQGFEIAGVVPSGEVAIQVAGDVRPDVVVMDIHLNGDMDGITAADHIYSMYHIPSIFLTAYADPSLLERAKKVGSFGFLLKPFDEFELKAALDMALYKQEAEIEKKLLEERLHQAAKMEAIGTLAGGIAHDFNNILAAIFGYSELIKSDLRAAGLSVDNIEKVLQASHRAKELVKQILAFSRHSEQSFLPLDVHSAVEEALDLLRVSIPATILISQDLHEYKGTILADRTQFFQVVMNLFSNAAHAVGKVGGSIRITLNQALPESNENKDGLALISVPHMCLSIEDNGCGIDEEIVKNIFDPYFTTKDIGEGTGMGLAVTAGIVKSHSGFISVESSPGKGSIFKVFIPETVHKAKETCNDGQSNLPGGKERILLVDDEQILTDMARDALTRSGYTVTAVNNSRDALNLFSACPEDFDLVITDHSMPIMTGIQLSENLQRIKKGIPVILCTGNASLVKKEDLKKAGIGVMLDKPYTRRVLHTAIQNILGAS